MPKFEANNLNGVMPAMITSFNKDESINKEGLRNIINHSINEKCKVQFNLALDLFLFFLKLINLNISLL